MFILIIFSWYYHCIDTSGAKGTTVAIDINRRPHIVYYSMNNQLAHVWWTGSAWQRENIAPVASYHNAGPSIVIDNLNRIHIAYYANNERLRYARFDGSWHIEQVDTTYRTGDHCDLELDANGNPHIAYHRYRGLFTGYLRYAKKTAGLWQITEITNESGGFHSNLEIDNQGCVHITDCTSWSGGDLRYIFYDGTNWQFEKPVLTNVGGYNSLVLDNMNRPQISFYWADGTNFDLKYTNKNTGSWQVFLVDHGLQLFKRGWDNHIVIDNSQILHIAYHAHNECLLKYARGSGNSWNIQILDSIGGYSSWIDIALDGNDIFISYHDEYTTDVWLATTRNLLKIEETEEVNITYPTFPITRSTIKIPGYSQLYDACGRLLVKNKSPEMIEVKIPDSGVYFICSENKGNQRTKKIVVMR